MCRRLCLGLLVPMFLVPVTASAFAQGTSAASISGVVTDTSGAVLPGVTVEASSPVLIEKVRAAVTDERGEYRIVELIPGTYTVTFTLGGFATLRREGLELPPSFNATVNANLRIGTIEESVTVSGASPLVDTQTVTRQTVLPKALLDAVPSAKTLLSFYALTPALQSPTNAQDVGGSKGETSSRASLHGSKQGDTKMLLDGMSFNWFEGEGSGRTFFVNALTAQEIVVDTPTGSTSAEYTSNGVVLNVIPREGGNRFSGTLFASGTNHNLQADNMNDALRAAGAITNSGTRLVYDVNAVLAGPIVADKLWFMTAHRRWGRQERIANLFHDVTLNDPVFTPADGTNGRAFEPGDAAEDLRSDDVRLTWQINQKNKVNAFYEFQWNNQPNNFAYLNGGVASMESGNPYCNRPQLFMGTWNNTSSGHLLFEAGVLLFNSWQDTSANPCAGIPTNRLYRDPTLSFPFNGNGPVVSRTGQRPFKQRFSMTYATSSHRLKAGFAVDESLPYQSYVDRGPTPFTVTFSNGTPISLTEYASPTNSNSEVKIRPDLGIFLQDQWTFHRVTLNLGLRYEYHRTKADPVTTFAGPLVDAHVLPGMDCIPCWHDIDPRVGVVWDVFGDGKTAVKGQLGRYVGLVSWVMSKTFNPQSAIVTSTSRSWTTTRAWFPEMVPNCDLRNPNANGFGGDTCGTMANKNFGQEIITTAPDPSWIQGWGKRPYNWSGSIAVERQLANGVALTAGFYRTEYGNFTVTRNTAVNPTDFSPYCITAPVDSRLPASVSGQPICGLYDINPNKFGLVNNVVTLASNFGNASEYYNGADVNVIARLPRGINISGGWNIGNSISLLTTWPGVTTSKSNQCVLVNSPEDLKYQIQSGVAVGCETGNPYQNLVKINGSVPLPWDLQAAAVYQSIPGPNYGAIYTYGNAQITGLNRPLSGNVKALQVDLLQPLSQYFDYRINQLDVRLSKIFRSGSRKFQLNVDVYNVMNGSYALWTNNNYGSNGATWQRPTSTFDARLVKFGAQFDF
ncbi:MAG TPA: TonB-dependent receptor [Vicinamibacterales bacterium]|nr:TonB-dependent receptor [Vicinamibacterales bacterium]